MWPLSEVWREPIILGWTLCMRSFPTLWYIVFDLSWHRKIIGFPCAQFGLQEIGQNAEVLPILEHVRPGGGFKPHFLLTEKVLVNGKHISIPYLTSIRAPSPPGVDLVEGTCFWAHRSSWFYLVDQPCCQNFGYHTCCWFWCSVELCQVLDWKRWSVCKAILPFHPSFSTWGGD